MKLVQPKLFVLVALALSFRSVATNDSNLEIVRMTETEPVEGLSFDQIVKTEEPNISPRTLSSIQNRMDSDRVLKWVRVTGKFKHASATLCYQISDPIQANTQCPWDSDFSSVPLSRKKVFELLIPTTDKNTRVKLAAKDGRGDVQQEWIYLRNRLPTQPLPLNEWHLTAHVGTGLSNARIQEGAASETRSYGYGLFTFAGGHARYSLAEFFGGILSPHFGVQLGSLGLGDSEGLTLARSNKWLIEGKVGLLVDKPWKTPLEVSLDFGASHKIFPGQVSSSQAWLYRFGALWMGMSFAGKFYDENKFSLGLDASARVLIPRESDTYLIRSGYGGEAGVRISLWWGDTLLNVRPFAKWETFTLSILSQTQMAFGLESFLVF